MSVVPAPDSPHVGPPDPPDPFEASGAGAPCRECGAPTHADQRYCLACGALVGVRRLDPLAIARGTAFADPAAPDAGDGEGVRSGLLAHPAPMAAVAVVALIAATSTVLGGAASQAAPRVIARSASAPAATVAPPAAAATATSEDPATTASTDDASASTDDTGPAEPATEAPTADPAPSDTTSTDAAPAAAPPTVGHAWVVALQGPDAAAAIDAVKDRGVLLSAATTMTQGPMANALGVVAGAPPTPARRAGCAGATAGEDPCALAASDASLPGLLTAAKLPWRGYLDVVPSVGAQPAGTCAPPAAGDTAGAAIAAVSPFAHVPALTTDGSCAFGVTGLDQLATDDASDTSTPAFSYVGLNGCAPAGATAVPLATQLASTLKAITGGETYGEDGMVVVTAIGTEAAACAAPGAAPTSTAPATPTTTTTADPTATVAPTPTAGAPADPSTVPTSRSFVAPAAPIGATAASLLRTGGRASTRVTFPGDPAAPAGDPSPMLVLSQWSKAGSTSDDAYDQLSIPRTLSALFKLAAPGASADDGVSPFGTDVLGDAAPDPSTPASGSGS